MGRVGHNYQEKHGRNAVVNKQGERNERSH